MAVDKNKALETALTQIEKQFGKGAVMRLGENKHMNIEHISTAFSADSSSQVRLILSVSSFFEWSR